MRILIYGLNYPPELIGVGKYTGEFAQWLASQGHEIRVVTASPYYPYWQIQDGYSGWWYSSGRMDSIRVVRCPLWVPKRPNFLSRIVHLKTFAISSFPIILWEALRFRPTIIMTIAPTFFCAPGALLAAWLADSKSWLHFQDIESDAAFGLRLLRGHALRMLFDGCERWLLRKFDRISSISEKMVERLVSKGCEVRKTILFPNWVDTKAIFPCKTTDTLRQHAGLPRGRFIAMYSGNLGVKQGLEMLIGAARILQNHADIGFVIAGDGVLRSQLCRWAEELPNVMVLPLQPADTFNEFLNAADVHILPQLAGVADMVMPSKLLGILAAGGVVIATPSRGTSLAKTIEEAGGIVVEPGDPQNISDAVLELYADREAMLVKKNQARQFAIRHFDKTTVLAELARELESVGRC